MQSMLNWNVEQTKSISGKTGEIQIKVIDSLIMWTDDTFLVLINVLWLRELLTVAEPGRSV